MMKCKKGLVAGVVAVCMMGAMGVNAFAADEAITGTTEETTRNTTLSYKVDQSYTWTVPSTINFTDNAIQNSTVSVSKNVIGEGKMLAITIKGNGGTGNEFSIKNKEGGKSTTLVYSVKKDDKTVSSGESILTVNAGTNEGTATLTFSLTKDPTEIAGDYEGTVTYTANVVKQSEE